jgi:hypothetical protein
LGAWPQPGELFARLVENDLPVGAGVKSMKSGHGITSVKFDAEKFADGQDLTATAAFTTDSYVSAPQVAGVASPLAEQAFLTTRTLIDGVGDPMVLATQLVSEVGERGPTGRLAVVESERLLTAARRAETAAAVCWNSTPHIGQVTRGWLSLRVSSHTGFALMPRPPV